MAHPALARGRTLPTSLVLDRLADRRHVVAIVRLMLDRDGQLIQGEVVGIEAGAGPRFIGWPGLTPAVRAWLAGQVRALGT